MALTPYPSLATLPEVISNAGKVPARSIDAFSGRTVFASTLFPASELAARACDPRTGLTAAGHVPTDSVGLVNAVLAQATAMGPVKLVIDCGLACGAAISIPQTGHATIEGLGWGTGFFWLAGSNCSQIQTSNVGTTNASHSAAISPAGPQSIVGKDVRLSNFHMNCNRGTFPTGLVSSNPYDGTIPGAVHADARGLLDAYWITSVLIVGIENLHIDRVSIYDSPSFAIDLRHCTHFWIDHCRIEAANPAFSGNTDGIHVNGGCRYGLISNCWFSTGDDAIAFNLEEGDAQPGGDFLVDNCIAVNCQSFGRVYGQATATRRITFQDCQGYGMRAWAFQVGNYVPVTAECNHSVFFRNCDIQVAGPSIGYGYSFLYLNGSCGIVELENCHLVEPTAAVPLVLYGQAQPTVSALRLLDCGVYRNGSGSAACPAFACESGGHVGDLAILDFHLTEQRNVDGTWGNYADVPAMIDLGRLDVGKLAVSGSFKGAATIVNVPSTATVGSIEVPDISHASNATSPAAYSIANASRSTVPVSVGRYSGVNLAGLASGPVALTGPGLVSSGYPLADSQVGPNSVYYSATGGVLTYKDRSGVAFPILLGAGSGAVTGAGHALALVAASNAGSGTPLGAADAAAFRSGGGATSFTAGLFVKFASTPSSLFALMGKWDATSSATSEWLLYRAGSQVTFVIQSTTPGGTPQYTVTAGTTLATGPWYFVVGVYDIAAGQVRIYVNGASDATPFPARPDAVASTTPFRIGGAAAPAGWSLDGEVAMAFKYSSALTPVQIAWLYNGGLGRSTSVILGQAGLTTPDFLYGFENSSSIGADSGPNNLSLAPAYATPPSQGTGPA